MKTYRIRINFVNKVYGVDSTFFDINLTGNVQLYVERLSRDGVWFDKGNTSVLIPSHNITSIEFRELQGLTTNLKGATL